jgi:hypothetical protein
LLWVAFLVIVVFKKIPQIVIPEKLYWIIFSILVIFSLLLTISVRFVFPMLPWGKSTVSTSSSSGKLSASDCKPLYDKYNKKVLNISGTGISGSISITINPEDCKSVIRYINLINTTLADKHYKLSPYKYNYIGARHTPAQTDRGHYGVGTISVVNQNQGKLPDPFADSRTTSDFFFKGTGNVDTTDWFYNSTTREPYFSEKIYQELVTETVFEIIDGQNFIKEETLQGGGYSYGIDHEAAEKSAPIVKTFNMTIK